MPEHSWQQFSPAAAAPAAAARDCIRPTRLATGQVRVTRLNVLGQSYSFQKSSADTPVLPTCRVSTYLVVDAHFWTVWLHIVSKLTCQASLTQSSLQNIRYISFAETH